MRSLKRAPAKPAVESMESRTLLSATPARAVQVSVINPGIEVIGDYYGSSTLATSTPKTLQFVVLSQSGAHPFAPLNALVPGSIKVDGIAFRNVTIRPDPIDVNGDGIPDAIVTVTTHSSLKLPAGPGLLTVTGTTRYHAGGHPVVWTSAAPIDVLGGAGGGLMQVQGYINIINDTGLQVSERMLANSPPGGNVPAGTVTPLYQSQVQEVYTGQGTNSQLVIQANFTIPGTPTFPAVWYSGNMTVSSFTPPSIINWYLLLNTQTNTLYFSLNP